MAPAAARTQACQHALARPRFALILPARCRLAPCPCFAAVKQGVRQLQAQANILLEAQALSSPDVQQHGPLHVVGTVVVGAGALPPNKLKHWESVRLPVGGAGSAPKTVMQLRIRR